MKELAAQLFGGVKQVAIEAGPDVVKGAAGITGTGASVYVSLLPKVEAWLRICSLLAGTLVAMVTVASILYSIYRKQKGIEK